jgi:hypothetical protein
MSNVGLIPSSAVALYFTFLALLFVMLSAGIAVCVSYFLAVTKQLFVFFYRPINY